MYICIYVCMYVCIYICIYMYTGYRDTLAARCRRVKPILSTALGSAPASSSIFATTAQHLNH